MTMCTEKSDAEWKTVEDERAECTTAFVASTHMEIPVTISVEVKSATSEPHYLALVQVHRPPWMSCLHLARKRIAFAICAVFGFLQGSEGPDAIRIVLMKDSAAPFNVVTCKVVRP